MQKLYPNTYQTICDNQLSYRNVQERDTISHIPRYLMAHTSIEVVSQSAGITTTNLLGYNSTPALPTLPKTKARTLDTQIATQPLSTDAETDRLSQAWERHSTGAYYPLSPGLSDNYSKAAEYNFCPLESSDMPEGEGVAYGLHPVGVDDAQITSGAHGPSETEEPTLEGKTHMYPMYTVGGVEVSTASLINSVVYKTERSRKYRPGEVCHTLYQTPSPFSTDFM